MWCKNNSISKFLHVINIHFCQHNVCFLIHLVWAHCAQDWKVSFENQLMCMQIPSCFATCTHVRCRLSTTSIVDTCTCCVWWAVLIQHYVFCYFILIIKGSGGISVTCGAIAVQLSAEGILQWLAYRSENQKCKSFPTCHKAMEYLQNSNRFLKEVCIYQGFYKMMEAEVAQS